MHTYESMTNNFSPKAPCCRCRCRGRSREAEHGAQSGVELPVQARAALVRMPLLFLGRFWDPGSSVLPVGLCFARCRGRRARGIGRGRPGGVLPWDAGTRDSTEDKSHRGVITRGGSCQRRCRQLQYGSNQR